MLCKTLKRIEHNDSRHFLVSFIAYGYNTIASVADPENAAHADAIADEETFRWVLDQTTV